MLTHTGGWEFSDAGATRYTWSQMASSQSNRGTFIASVLQFLEKWEFQGVDIDWEWPGAESRGGNPAIDMRNQIDLMVELRKAVGSRGLSVVLPAQYEYLKYLDPKALEAQVDHFNVLSYDLHGVSFIPHIPTFKMLTYQSLGMLMFPARARSSSRTPTSRKLTPRSTSSGSTTSTLQRSTLASPTMVADTLSPTRAAQSTGVRGPDLPKPASAPSSRASCRNARSSASSVREI